MTMQRFKVCLGCFAEWEQESVVCPYCGWEPGKRYPDMFQWNIGAVLEQRYLLGMLFLRTRDIAVWRIYDNLLKIPCFLLRKRPDNAEELTSIAARLQSVSGSGGDYIQILAVKPVDGQNTLLFSMKGRYVESSLLKQYLLSALSDCFEQRKEIESREDCGGYRADHLRTDQDDRTPGAGGQKAQALPAGTYLDRRFRVIDCIGIGGFGITYLCEDELLHRRTAVKEYFPSEWVERDGQFAAVKTSDMVEACRYGMKSFLKEACITARFIHTPHIVTIYDVIEANDTLYLAMEYIPGISVGRRMRMRGYRPYTPRETAKMIFPILEVLEEMHSKNIVHSDISPGNIICSDEGDITLIDMGASKYLLESQPPLSAAFLKLDYAAPEQYRTAKEGIPKDEGPWTDIYGLGAVMYYLLTGHKPTNAVSRLSGRDQNLVPPRKYKVKLAGRWMRLIRHAMALDRNERIGSAAEFREELRKLMR